MSTLSGGFVFCVAASCRALSLTGGDEPATSGLLIEMEAASTTTALMS